MSLNRSMRRQAMRASAKNENVFRRSRINEQPENGQEDESFIKNMLGSISKSPFMKKVLLNAIGLTLMAAPAAVASEIEAIGHTTVNTTAILDSNNQSTGHYNYDITTGKRQYVNSIDLNAFKKFNLDNGDVANFFKTINDNNTIQKDAPIINFVQDKININGVVNCIESLSHDKREIGGRLFFISSNGILIGSTGVINTGCFYAIVPNEEFVNKFVNFADEFHPFESSGFLKYVQDEWNDAAFFNDNDSNETNAQKQERLDNLITRNISSITLSDTGIIEVNGTINAKRNVELLAGKTYKSGETDIDKSASIIIGPNAHINTYSYDTRQDFVMSALNLNESDTQAINSAMELYENDYGFENNEDNGKNPFGIRIRAIGQDGTAPTANGYATAIKSEGTLTSQKNVEFITEMATENATAKNAIQVSGTINANGTATGWQAADVRGLYIQGDGDVILGTSGHNLTVTENTRLVEINAGKDIKETANTTNTLKANNEDQFGSNPIILNAGNNIELANTTMTTKKGVHLTSGGSTKAGDLTGDKIVVQAATGIELNNVTANGYTTENAGWTSNKYSWDGEVKLTNTDSGKIKVTGTILSNGYAKNAQGENVTDGQGKFVQETGIGDITVDNGNKQNVNYNNYSNLSGQDVELKEVKGKAIGLSGYNVTADKIVTNTSASVVAGGKFTLGEDNQQAFYNADATLMAEARSIETKGSVTAKSISLNSREGANLGGALTTTNGNIGIDNHGANGTVTINGNVVARKEDHYANIGIYNRDGEYDNAQGGSIAIAGNVEGKQVRISAVDNVSLGNVTATYSEQENWDDEPGHLTIDGKNVTVAENKNLTADRSIRVTAGEVFDAKNSAINAGTSIDINAQAVEVKTTTSGSDTFIGARDSIIAHGKLTAGTDLRLGTEWQIVDNDTDQAVGTGFTSSITLEDDTLSGSAYVEPPQQSLAAIEGLNFSVGGGYTTYDTIIKAESVNSQKKNTAKGTLWVFGNGTASFNETVSEGKGYVTDRRRETEFNVEDLTVNSITANGGVNISFTDNVTVAQKVESKENNVIIGGSSSIGGWSEGEANINGALAYGKVDITAKKVNLNNASAQLIRVKAVEGGNLSNLTSVDTGADVSDYGAVYDGSFGEAKISGGRTYTIKKGIYAENIEHSRITGYEPAEEEGYPDTPIYEYSKPSGDFVLAGTITANNGGVFVYNDGRDIILGKDNAPVTITGQAMSLYTQGNITDKTGNNALTATSDGGSLSFRAIGGVNLANTAINASGWFEVNNWFDNNAKVTISKDIAAKTVHIEANKGIEVGNITANGGNITLDNETKGIDYDTKIRRPDNWSYPDGIDEQGKFDWGSTKPTGDIVVNGNLTATVDPSDPNGEKSKTGDITISNGYWSSYSQDDEEGATVVKNVTMKDATGRTININVSSELKAGNLTSTWEEQSPTRMESRIKYKLDENGQRIKDDDGYYIYEEDEDGNYVYEDVEVENWDRTGLTVGAAEVAIGNIKSNNGVSLQNRKIAVGDVEGTNITLVANEGIEAGNITVNGTKDAYGVEISNENLYQGHYVEPTEIEGGNGSLRKGSLGDWAWTYTPPTGTVKVSSVKFMSRTTPITKTGKYAIKIKNSSLLETPKKGEEESSSSSMYEEYKDATLDPNFKGGENGGVKVGSIEGGSVQIISDHGISVGQINTEPVAEENNSESPAENEDYSVNLINRLTDDIVTEMIGDDFDPLINGLTDDVVAEMIGDDFEPTLRAEPADGSAAGSIIAKNGGIRIENQAEGGKITVGDVEGTVVYMKAKGKVSMANVTATKNGDNTLESPAVKPLYIESEGDDVVISGNIEAVGGREIKSRTGGYITPANPETPDKPVVTPEDAPTSQEEAKQIIEDVAGEKGVEEIDRTINGNQENTDNTSNQDVAQINDVSSLADMGSDNIGGFEEMGSDAGGIDVGLSEGNAAFSVGEDGSFAVASVDGSMDANDAGSDAAGTTENSMGDASDDMGSGMANEAGNDAGTDNEGSENNNAGSEGGTEVASGQGENDNTESDTDEVDDSPLPDETGNTDDEENDEDNEKKDNGSKNSNQNRNQNQNRSAAQRTARRVLDNILRR